jgi:AcrR family transcriptional regulator
MQQRIINTAESMFFRFGIRSVTMDDIAKELGISKKNYLPLFH